MANPIEGKQYTMLSGNTVFRCKAPANPRLIEKVPSMAWKYNDTQRVFPDANDAFIEKTPANGIDSYTSMNPKKKAMRLKSDIGSGEADTPVGKLFLSKRGTSRKAKPKKGRY